MSYKKEWNKKNRHFINRNKARFKLKTTLISYNILPNTSPYNKFHEEVMDNLKANNFDLVRKIIKENKPIKVKKSYNKKPKLTPEKILENKKERRIKLIQDSGILPINLTNLNEREKEILNLTINTDKLPLKIIDTYLDTAKIEYKRKFLYTRLKERVNCTAYRKKGKYVDLKPEDIVINEYCPFLNEKINYDKQKRNVFVNNSYSFDRLNNQLGYIKGNVWIISRFANVIKNDASLPQLKTFCINIILQHENKVN